MKDIALINDVFFVEMSSQHESKFKKRGKESSCQSARVINKKKELLYHYFLHFEITACEIDHFEISKDFYELNCKSYEDGENLYLLS